PRRASPGRGAPWGTWSASCSPWRGAGCRSIPRRGCARWPRPRAPTSARPSTRCGARPSRLERAGERRGRRPGSGERCDRIGAELLQRVLDEPSIRGVHLAATRTVQGVAEGGGLEGLEGGDAGEVQIVHAVVELDAPVVEHAL